MEDKESKFVRQEIMYCEYINMAIKYNSALNKNRGKKGRRRHIRRRN